MDKVSPTALPRPPAESRYAVWDVWYAGPRKSFPEPSDEHVIVMGDAGAVRVHRWTLARMGAPIPAVYMYEGSTRFLMALKAVADVSHAIWRATKDMSAPTPRIEEDPSYSLFPRGIPTPGLRFARGQLETLFKQLRYIDGDELLAMVDRRLAQAEFVDSRVARDHQRTMVAALKSVSFETAPLSPPTLPEDHAVTADSALGGVARWYYSVHLSRLCTVPVTTMGETAFVATLGGAGVQDWCLLTNRENTAAALVCAMQPRGYETTACALLESGTRPVVVRWNSWLPPHVCVDTMGTSVTVKSPTAECRMGESLNGPLVTLRACEGEYGRPTYLSCWAPLETGRPGDYDTVSLNSQASVRTNRSTRVIRTSALKHNVAVGMAAREDARKALRRLSASSVFAAPKPTLEVNMTMAEFERYMGARSLSDVLRWSLPRTAGNAGRARIQRRLPAAALGLTPVVTLYFMHHEYAAFQGEVMRSDDSMKWRGRYSMDSSTRTITRCDKVYRAILRDVCEGYRRFPVSTRQLELLVSAGKSADVAALGKLMTRAPSNLWFYEYQLTAYGTVERVYETGHRETMCQSPGTYAPAWPVPFVRSNVALHLWYCLVPAGPARVRLIRIKESLECKTCHLSTVCDIVADYAQICAQASQRGTCVVFSGGSVVNINELPPKSDDSTRVISATNAGRSRHLLLADDDGLLGYPIDVRMNVTKDGPVPARDCIKPVRAASAHDYATLEPEPCDEGHDEPLSEPGGIGKLVKFTSWDSRAVGVYAQIEERGPASARMFDRLHMVDLATNTPIGTLVRHGCNADLTFVQSATAQIDERASAAFNNLTVDYKRTRHFAVAYGAPFYHWPVVTCAHGAVWIHVDGALFRAHPVNR